MAITRKVVEGTAARSRVERTRGASLTYAPVGISLGWAQAPEGFREVRSERVIGHGEDVYRKVGYALMHWQINSEAGFFVQPQHISVREGERVGVVLGVAPFIGVSAICEVVAVIAEGNRTGFAYGTLPGHPQRGEESFVLEHRGDDSVVMVVTAVSKAEAWYVRAAGPLARAKQAKATQHYLDAAEHFAQAPGPVVPQERN